MKKTIRWILVLALAFGVAALAGGQAAWARPEPNPLPTPAAQDDPGVLLKYRRGTVNPPRRRIRVCRDGLSSVGGVATVNISQLGNHYCIWSFLWRSHVPPAHVYPGEGEILVDVTFIDIRHSNHHQDELPVTDGRVEVCFAVPPGRQAQIYFLDYYRQIKNQQVWVPLETNVQNGVACAPAQISGAYTLVGK